MSQYTLSAPLHLHPFSPPWRSLASTSSRAVTFSEGSLDHVSTQRPGETWDDDLTKWAPHGAGKKKIPKKRGETVTLTLMISIFCIICIHQYIYIDHIYYVQICFSTFVSSGKHKSSGCFFGSCLVPNQSY